MFMYLTDHTALLRNLVVGIKTQDAARALTTEHGTLNSAPSTTEEERRNKRRKERWVPRSTPKAGKARYCTHHRSLLTWQRPTKNTTHNIRILPQATTPTRAHDLEVTDPALADSLSKHFAGNIFELFVCIASAPSRWYCQIPLSAAGLECTLIVSTGPVSLEHRPLPLRRLCDPAHTRPLT